MGQDVDAVYRNFTKKSVNFLNQESVYRLIAVDHLRPVVGVDANIIVGHIACPDLRLRFSSAKIERYSDIVFSHQRLYLRLKTR